MSDDIQHIYLKFSKPQEVF